MKPLVFKLHNDIYPFTVVYIVGERPTDLFAGRVAKRYGLWNGKGNTPGVGDGLGATIHFQCGCLVWLSKSGFQPDPMEHFVHEMVHVLSNLQKLTGCFLDRNTDEFHAYYAGWLTKEFVKRIKRAGR